MKRVLLTTISGIIIVISYDVIGSLLSRSYGFDYSWLAFDSLAIYGSAGFIGAHKEILGGVFAAAAVGITDATVGWYLSWLIQPVTNIEEITIFTIAGVIPFVTFLATVVGMLGALGRHSLRRE